MGGTFNPVHYGHLLIAENAYEQYNLDEVIFLPNGTSPHKDLSQILSAGHRMEMIKLAIADNAHFSLSDYEVKKGGVSYTYLTVSDFCAMYPDCELHFIMGADSLAYFDSWKHPEQISRQCMILAAVRDELNMDGLLPIRKTLYEKYGTRIEFISTPNFSVSSRIIRKRLEEHRSVRYLVPDAVEQYIKTHQIYNDKDTR